MDSIESQSGSNWAKNVQKCPENGQKLPKMVTNGQKWAKTAKNGQKRLKNGRNKLSQLLRVRFPGQLLTFKCDDSTSSSTGTFKGANLLSRSIKDIRTCTSRFPDPRTPSRKEAEKKKNYVKSKKFSLICDTDKQTFSIGYCIGIRYF